LQDIDTYHRYTILVQPDDDWKFRSKNFRSVPCPYPQFSFSPLDQFLFAWQLYRLKPDLVHFTMTQQPLFYFGNIVTTTHDLTMFNFVRRGATPLPLFKLKMGLYGFLFRWSHMKSKKILVPSKFVAEDLGNYQPSTRKKTVVTYEAGTLPRVEKPMQPKQVSKKDTFIMYLGTAFPHKNLPRLLDAFDILHAERPNLKLVLVGKKEIHYKELEQNARKHPSAKNIIITGFLPDAEAKWLYQHTEAYVFPSLSEGFGLPALEAMANGAAVVSSDATCLPELYEDAAHYFNPQSPKDMADKISEVLDNPRLRKRLIENGKIQPGKFSWHRMAEETLMVYKELTD
jgi:glycosyltransferase involved in cell wall biosynthesis